MPSPEENASLTTGPFFCEGRVHVFKGVQKVFNDAPGFVFGVGLG